MSDVMKNIFCQEQIITGVTANNPIKDIFGQVGFYEVIPSTQATMTSVSSMTGINTITM